MEIVAELVGFVVIVFVLWKYVLPVVGSMVEKRQDEVQHQVYEAQEATRKLEEARARFDNAVQRAEAEGARIRDDARAEATHIREELKAQAEAEVERMLQRGREQLVAERDHAVRRLRAELGGASMDLAERVVRTTLDDDSAREDTVESFLSEIESLQPPPGSAGATTVGGASLLQSASRDSLSDLSARLDVFVDQVQAADLDRLADQLFSVAQLLSGETALRRHLADPAVPEQARTFLVERLFGGKLDRPALEAVVAAVETRWSRSVDLVNALEALSRNAVLASVHKGEQLDDVEDELFRFGRILDREPQLTELLADTSRPLDGRLALLDRLLTGKVTPATATLLRQAVSLPRGRRLDAIAEELADMAAARRKLSVARVTTPVRLTPHQEQRLTDGMSRLYGRPMSLQVELDESLLGGLVVRVGGELVDGSVAARLAAARRSLPR